MLCKEGWFIPSSSTLLPFLFNTQFNRKMLFIVMGGRDRGGVIRMTTKMHSEIVLGHIFLWQLSCISNRYTGHHMKSALLSAGPTEVYTWWGLCNLSSWQTTSNHNLHEHVFLITTKNHDSVAIHSVNTKTDWYFWSFGYCWQHAIFLCLSDSHTW